MGDALTRQYFVDLFSEYGIDQSRMVFEDSSPLNEYLRWFANIDIILDTFPFAGGTTTCHALYMGVPVVTRSGRTSVSRVGSSVLHNIGLADLVAATPEQFVQIAVELANDRKRLVELRQTMRKRMIDSPLMNARQFVGHLEAAYRKLWAGWCGAMS